MSFAAGWLYAFSLTVAIELPVVLLLTQSNALTWRRRAAFGLLAQLITHPLVWFVFPTIPGITGRTALTLSELCAWIVEAGVYVLAGVAPTTLSALGVAGVANGLSLAAGVLMSTRSSSSSERSKLRSHASSPCRCDRWPRRCRQEHSCAASGREARLHLGRHGRSLSRGCAAARRKGSRGKTIRSDRGREDHRYARSLSLTPDPEKGVRVLLEGEDVSDAIRAADMGMGASRVSAIGGVREALFQLQRMAGEQGGVVLEGRDIGTVVFPDAEAKFFLTATPEVRAQRRFEELVARGQNVDYASTLAEVIARDHQDTTRPIAPLRQADDAVIVDSSNRAIDDVVDEMAKRVARASEP